MLPRCPSKPALASDRTRFSPPSARAECARCIAPGTRESVARSRSRCCPPASPRRISSAPEPGAAPDFLGVTFRRGCVGGARFAPDGSIVYGAAWEGQPLEVFVSQPGRPDARPVGLADSDVLSVSASGELAVSLGRRFLGGWVSTGTLARIPLAGGAPRRIAATIVNADWTPGGKNFAIIRQAEDGSVVLECPIGRRLRASGGWLSRIFPIFVTPGGESYAYSYRRCLSDLYLVSGAALPRERRDHE